MSDGDEDAAARPRYEKTSRETRISSPRADAASAGAQTTTILGVKVPTGWKRIAGVAAIGLVIVMLLSLAMSGRDSSGPGKKPTTKSTSTPRPTEKPAPASQGSKKKPLGAVSSTHYLATEAGFATLRAGGNAVDAAAVMQFMLNVVQPQSTGIGGGCFVVIYNASTGKVSTLDGREEAPNAYHENIFCKDAACAEGSCECSEGIGFWSVDELSGGGLSVGVPGVPAAVDRMLREAGTWTLAEAVKPAVERARVGFRMYAHLHDKIQQARARLSVSEAATKLFLKDDKTTPRVPVGGTFTNADLAATLERLGAEGVEDFYRGRLAEEIVGAAERAVHPVTGRRGLLTREDLAGYRAVWRRPVKTTYRGYEVYGMGPPSGGAMAIAEALNILEGTDVRAMRHNSADYLHAVADAMNLAWADRNAYAADADFVDELAQVLRHEDDAYCQTFASETQCPAGCEWNLPNGGAVPPSVSAVSDAPGAAGDACGAAGLLSKSYARGRRELMPRTAVRKPPLPPGNFSALLGRQAIPRPATQDKSGTTHLSVVDAAGNMVAMTTTIEQNMGSGVVVPGRGFLLNNELTDFSFDSTTGSGAGFANKPQGGKRLRATALGPDALTSGGKRPRSSMSPTLVLDQSSKPFLAIGSPGGGRITFTVLGALIAVLDMRMSLKEAIDAPRAIARNGPLEIETRSKCRCSNPLGEDAYLMSVLRARGIGVSWRQGSATADYLEAVMLMPNASMTGYADTNRMPTALGYGL